jgi:hypothetical protein
VSAGVWNSPSETQRGRASARGPNSMEHVQELVRSTSRKVAAQSPLRFSARDAAPLPYDVDGLDAEKLGYRLGTLALAAVATPYLLSDAVVRRNWAGDGGVRGPLCLGLSLLAVARVTWTHVAEWPSVASAARLGGLLPPAPAGSASSAKPSAAAAQALADELPTSHVARELLPESGEADAGAPARRAPSPEPARAAPAETSERELEPEPELRDRAWSRPQPRTAPATAAAAAAAAATAATTASDRHPRVPRPRAVAGRSGSRVVADDVPTAHPDGVIEDLVEEERREAARNRRQRVRSAPPPVHDRASLGLLLTSSALVSTSSSCRRGQRFGPPGRCCVRESCVPPSTSGHRSTSRPPLPRPRRRQRSGCGALSWSRPPPGRPSSPIHRRRPLPLPPPMCRRRIRRTWSWSWSWSGSSSS